MKVLLTTPDFPPKIGGLSVFSKNILDVLKLLDVDTELLVWNSYQELQEKGKNLKDNYEFIINIHPLALKFLKINSKQINFYHGSEILFFSSNPIKRFIKRLYKRQF